MALDPQLFTVDGLQGTSSSKPTLTTKLVFPGDASYPTGGSAGVKAVLDEVLQRKVTVTAVTGYSFKAGAYFHLAHYDLTNDKLQLFVRSTGAEEANATDQSTAEMHLTVHWR